MEADLLHGFAGALVSAAVSAGAEVAAEPDLVVGGRYKLAVNCRKDGYYAQRRWYRTYWLGTRHRSWYVARPRPGPMRRSTALNSRAPIAVVISPTRRFGMLDEAVRGKSVCLSWHDPRIH